jgi:hypothetical protein
MDTDRPKKPGGRVISQPLTSRHARMNTEHFIHNLKKRGNLQVEIGLPATSDQITEVEKKIGVKFPEQVKWFFQACNGLRVIEPAISVKPLSDLKIGQNSTIEFAVFDNQHILSFDAARINEAGQWSIVNSETGFVVTKTMASFWSNKIFAWLDNRRTIWTVEQFC